MCVAIRQWYSIINDPGFVTAHLQRCTSIFLVQFPKFRYQYLHVGECKIKLWDIQFQFPGRVLATCNGLILVQDRRYQTTHRLYYKANPVTNRVMTLPTLPLNEFRCSLAFAASSNAYKVIVVTQDRYECAILTVSVDRAWRLINCADMDEFLFLLAYGPVMNRGFMYWALDEFLYMLALNIESESFKTISLPQIYRTNTGQSYFLPKGNTISYIHIYWDYSIKVWVLKDHETEEWVVFPDLRFDEIRREATIFFSLKHLDFYHLANFCQPVSWLKNEEKILFEFISDPNSLLVYDVKTGGTSTFTSDFHDIILPHVSSLT